jgi:hypothetical protein
MVIAPKVVIEDRHFASKMIIRRRGNSNGILKAVKAVKMVIAFCFLLFDSQAAVKELIKEFIKGLKGTAILRRKCFRIRKSLKGLKELKPSHVTPGVIERERWLPARSTLLSHLRISSCFLHKDCRMLPAQVVSVKRGDRGALADLPVWQDLPVEIID